MMGNLSPSLQQIAYADTAYSSLDISTWGSDNTTIEYGYDANGSLTTKDTSRGDGTSQEVTNTYNLQGRLETVTTKEYDATPDLISTSEATYTYNPQGIRVSKDVDDTITDYLIDPYNHTGHAQVLEETTGSSTITYTIGDDVIAQHNAADGTEYMLYDGHGSTRQLLNADKSVADTYSYDGYGVMLGTDDTAADNADTTMLYAGEQYDSSASMYYNRARYYNPSNGLFNRVDPYSGNTQDPQSLHKYAYCHNNPINNIDPSGKMSLGEVVYIAACVAILSGTITYNYTASLKASFIVGVAAFVATFIALGGIGLAMAAITGGGVVASPTLLNPSSWQEAETMLGKVLQIPKNTITYVVDGMVSGRVPDFVLRGKYIADSKWYQVPLNVGPQLRDFVILAKEWEVPLYIYVRTSTHVSQPAIDLIESTGGGVFVIFK